MTLTELEAAAPALKEYTKNMPEDIRSRCTVRTHAAGSIIHQKNMELGYFGIVAKGENRVINEFENGNVYMIESNKAIDFIGEVTWVYLGNKINKENAYKIPQYKPRKAFSIK